MSTILFRWLGCKWPMQLALTLQNGDMIYRTYLPLHFFTELHLHALLQVTPKRVKVAWILCSCLIQLLKSFFKNFSIKEQFFFSPPLYGSLTGPGFVWEMILESWSRGKGVFRWKFGDWEILFLSFFLPFPFSQRIPIADIQGRI